MNYNMHNSTHLRLCPSRCCQSDSLTTISRWKDEILCRELVAIFSIRGWQSGDLVSLWEEASVDANHVSHALPHNSSRVLLLRGIQVKPSAWPEKVNMVLQYVYLGRPAVLLIVTYFCLWRSSSTPSQSQPTTMARQHSSTCGRWFSCCYTTALQAVPRCPSPGGSILLSKQLLDAIAGHIITNCCLLPWSVDIFYEQTLSGKLDKPNAPLALWSTSYCPKETYWLSTNSSGWSSASPG